MSTLSPKTTFQMVLRALAALGTQESALPYSSRQSRGRSVHFKSIRPTSGPVSQLGNSADRTACPPSLPVRRRPTDHDDVADEETAARGTAGRTAITQVHGGFSFPIAVEPHFNVDASLRTKDTLLLCTDGLTIWWAITRSATC